MLNLERKIQNPHKYIQKIRYSSKNTVSVPCQDSMKKQKDPKPEFKYEKHEDMNDNRKRSKSRNKIVIATSVSFFIVYIIYSFGKAELDRQGFPIRDDLSEKPGIVQYLVRCYRELKYYKKLLRAPPREKLLPDLLPYPYLQPKYTLVLELTDVLVHPEWTYNTGWRYKKRPLLNYFLDSLRCEFEIVIYTAEQGIVVFPLIEAIDPNKIIAHKLVRDATYFTGGHHIKALDQLNRDLSKVICIDWNAKTIKYNPENLFNIKRWTGNDNDTVLLDLVAFLKAIAANNIEDVREVLKYYSQFDDPIEAFKEKQQRLIEDLEQAAADKEQ